MAQVPITTEQLTRLKGLVDKLSTDKDAADGATAESSAAHMALQQAQMDVTTKDAAEADADTLVSSDTADLVSFVDGLLMPVIPANK